MQLFEDSDEKSIRRSLLIVSIMQIIVIWKRPIIKVPSPFFKGEAPSFSPELTIIALLCALVYLCARIWPAIYRDMNRGPFSNPFDDLIPALKEYRVMYNEIQSLKDKMSDDTYFSRVDRALEIQKSQIDEYSRAAQAAEAKLKPLLSAPSVMQLPEIASRKRSLSEVSNELESSLAAVYVAKSNIEIQLRNIKTALDELPLEEIYKRLQRYESVMRSKGRATAFDGFDQVITRNIPLSIALIAIALSLASIAGLII